MPSLRACKMSVMRCSLRLSASLMLTAVRSRKVGSFVTFLTGSNLGTVRPMLEGSITALREILLSSLGDTRSDRTEESAQAGTRG